MTRNIRDWIDDERAVSPVIGVILMVAITVILAAVIGTFVLDLGQSAGQTAPQASLSISLNEQANNVTVEHTGGDSIAASDTRVIIENASGESLTWDPASTTGDTLTVGGSVDFSTNATDGAAAATQPDVNGVWTDMGNPATADAFAINPGDQVTITIIDTNSQRQIFETTVTA